MAGVSDFELSETSFRSSRRSATLRPSRWIYNFRSRVVHGDSVVSDVVGKASERANELCIASRRALYREQPRLIAEKSSARSTALILAGGKAPPGAQPDAAA